jgi:hypothetical protein
MLALTNKEIRKNRKANCNPPLSGKLLVYQQFLGRKKQEEEKKKRKEKKMRKEGKKKKYLRKIKKNYFLPQRTGLKICHLEWPANVFTMMFSPRKCATLFKIASIY